MIENEQTQPDALPYNDMQEWIVAITTAIKEDNTAPFQDNHLTFIAELMDSDAPAYARLIAEFKKHKVDMALLNQAISRFRRNVVAADPEKRAMAEAIIAMMSDVTLFHDASNTAFANVAFEDGHKETWPVESKGFKHIVRGRFYKIRRSAPNAEAFKAALDTMIARAVVEGEEHTVYMRTARVGDKTYIDLANPEWSVVEVDATGYRVLQQSPVYFRRKAGMLPLPTPVEGGSIHDFRDFVNTSDDNSFVLIICWLLMALRGAGPYPILVIIGEQGTAKSTLVGWLRKLVDPNAAALRALPRTEHELFIAANNGLVQALDNLSFMPDWASDALCRLSTGGGFSARVLYTDDDEQLFDVVRPVIMNGIENVGTRGDLADRAVSIVLEPIDVEKRKTDEELQAKFNAIYPRLLGALLSMVSHGIGRLPSIKLDRAPRMADFAKWSAACETAVWPAGTYQAAHEANQTTINEDTIEASPLGMAVVALMSGKHRTWEGSASDLLTMLSTKTDPKIIADKKLWPCTPRVLSERLRRVTSTLRKIGIEIDRYHSGDRSIKITRTERFREFVSGVSAVTKDAAAQPSGAIKDSKERKF